ncbi:MAG: MbnP family protein [Bacteroidota bacterium]
MPKIIRKSVFYWLLTAVTCYAVMACYQPEVGCLDIEATNFSAGADEACGADDTSGDCPCDYPVLSFDTVDYVFAELDYSTSETYEVSGQTLQLNRVNFYLSGFQFTSLEGTRVGVDDTLSLVIVENNEVVTQIFPDDFVLVNGQRSVDIGAFKQSTAYDSIRFVVGIEDLANRADPESIADVAHPLARESMHTGSQETGYIFNQITFQTDTASQAKTLNVIGTEHLVEVNLPFSVKTPRGRDFSLGTLHIDYAEWFAGINFVTDSNEVMIEKIVSNTANAFSVSN